MLKNFLFLLLISLEPVWAHHLIFAKIEILSLSMLLIWMQCFLLFAFVCTFRAQVVALAVICESLLVWVHLIYHHYFAEPLTLQTIFTQVGEGITFAERSPASLLNLTTLTVVVIMSLQLLYLWRWYKPFPHRGLIRVVAAVPFICIAAASYNFFHNSKFEKKDFNEIAANFGYAQAWGYELVTNRDRKALIENIIADSSAAPAPLPEELKSVKIPNNVYVVQLESIDYAALTGVVDKKPLMPFMSALAKQGYLYVVQAHDKEASSNADFSVLTGTELYVSMFSMIYGLMPPTNYDKMFTLPNLFKSKGYVTRFYHGFLGRFFQRNAHMEAMGFDKIWFSDNLPLKVPEGAWGFDDADLFKFVTEDNVKHKADKNFNFIISVSSHEDFQIGNKHLAIVKSPSDMKERYYNAAHYVDSAIKQLVEKAPAHSLFVIYSDHFSNMFDDGRTFLLIYSKDAKNERYERTIAVSQVAKIIKSLFAGQ